MARSRPQVGTSASGAWAATMRVYDRIGTHEKTPWLIVATGDEAREWWEREGRTLEPGDTLQVTLERARVHTVAGDRYGATAEVQAHLKHCHIVARANKQEAAA